MRPQIVTDPRVDALLDRLDRLEGRHDVGVKRGRPRRGHVGALEERLTALEARVHAVEAAIRGSETKGRAASSEDRDPVPESDDATAPDPGGGSGDEAPITIPLDVPEQTRSDDAEVVIAAVDNNDDVDVADVAREVGEAPEVRPTAPDGEHVADRSVEAQTSNDVGADAVARRDSVLMAAFRQVSRDFIEFIVEEDNADTDPQGRSAPPGSRSDRPPPEDVRMAGQTATPPHREKQRRKKRKRRR
ncbi:MAG: hypothetical protein R3B09_25965 [Nannocystaceae bacterium]